MIDTNVPLGLAKYVQNVFGGVYGDLWFPDMLKFNYVEAGEIINVEVSDKERFDKVVNTFYFRQGFLPLELGGFDYSFQDGNSTSFGVTLSYILEVKKIEITVTDFSSRKGRGGVEKKVWWGLKLQTLFNVNYSFEFD